MSRGTLGNMARTWLSVTVELLGGRGDELWPPPGRVFAVGPGHTFEQLADAINTAFARWDRSHLSQFTLADGRIVTDEETAHETAGDLGGPVTFPLDIAVAKVSRTLDLGAEFKYTFDFGDDWVHRCVIDDAKIDPEQELGIRSSVPLPFWGWGTIPDQYGRRWEGDDGEAETPSRPRQRHPMLDHGWPGADALPELDLRAVRGAIARKDADAFLAALDRCEIDDALQQVGAGVPMALEQRREAAESVALSLVNRLRWRAFPGDIELSDDLLTLLRGEPLDGRVAPVDLDMLAEVLESNPEYSTGGYVDLLTGEAYDEQMADAAEVGEDAAIDPDADPDRWLRVDMAGSRSGWEDMVAFAERQRGRTGERLQNAIEGKGALRRFRELVDDEGLTDQWRRFSDERRIGRSRLLLADEGIRVR
ncbi:MAG: IS1096 element passenger TnpR family protein [Microbacteriaceae bacterium]